MVNLLKKVVALLFLSIALLSTYSFSYAQDQLELFGESAVLIDYDSLEILYEKNPHEKLFPASTTKIMTGILALENGNLSDVVTIEKDVVDMTDGTHIALEPGEELTLGELLDALLIESANDAANAIAKHISGSVDEFVDLMNEKAYSIGALNTHFKNPSGLPDEDHLTTAFDLALIAKYAMDNEAFSDIVRNYEGRIEPTNKKDEVRYLNSSNRLLYSEEKIMVDDKAVAIKFEGINGVKAGYTNAAQFCLVTSMERDGQKLIAVSLKSNRNNIYTDIHKLLGFGLNNFTRTKIGFSGKFLDNFDIEDGIIAFVPGITKTDSFSVLNPENMDDIEEVVVLTEGLKAPVSQDEVIGRVQYVLDGKVLAESDVVSAMDIRAVKRGSLFSKLLDKWYFVLLGGFILLRSITLLNRRRRRKKRRRTRALYKIR